MLFKTINQGGFKSTATFKVIINLDDNKSKTLSETVNINNGPVIFSLPKGSSFLDHFQFARFGGVFKFNNINKNSIFNLNIKPFLLSYTGRMDYKLNTKLNISLDKFSVRFKDKINQKDQDSVNSDINASLNLLNGAEFNLFINSNISEVQAEGEINGVISSYDLSFGKKSNNIF